jgi:phospholipase/lecithinase/hemolysin
MCLVFFTLSTSVAMPSWTADFTRLIVFGDSLSDTGNLLGLTGGSIPPDPPYQGGRYSNGNVWPEFVATALGIPLENYAYGGAQSGGQTSIYDGEIPNSNFPSLAEEISEYLADVNNAADPSAFFVLWAGANDLLDPGNASTITTVTDRAVDGLVAALVALRNAGAVRVVVGNLPDLGLIPYATSSSNPLSPAQLTRQSERFNARLRTRANTLGEGVTVFDSLALHRAAVASPSAFGFSNVTRACFDSPNCRNSTANQDRYLFWDDRHPTTAAHQLLAAQVLDAAQSGGSTAAELRLDRAESFGLMRPTSGQFLLRNDRIAGAPDYTPIMAGANPQMLPLAGDWNGDSVVSVGMYDASGGIFLYSNDNVTASQVAGFRYGPTSSNWMPLVGDWNGDGRDTVGLYRNANGNFHLINRNSAGRADQKFSFGRKGAGWLPLAGDWDGDGVDTIGLFDPATSTFFLRNEHAGGIADLRFGFGPDGRGWRPISGDWNGDGVDTVGLHDPVTGQFLLRNSNDSGVASIKSKFGPSAADWLPIAGDWNGRLLQ